MSVSVVDSKRGAMRPHEGFLIVLVVNLVLGVPAYFISFLFAYGFQDQIHLGNHLTFLTGVAIFATVTGAISMALPVTPSPRPPVAARVAFGVYMSLALNSAVVGVGSIVSATHKEENSVSATFSTTTDVLVASGLFLVALLLVAMALRVDLRAQSGSLINGPRPR